MIVTEKGFDKDIKDGEDSGYSLLTKSINFCILLSTSLWEFIVELLGGSGFHELAFLEIITSVRL